MRTLGRWPQLIMSLVNTLQQKPEKEEEQSWKHRRQHSMHHWQIEEVAYIEKSYQWVHKAGLIDST